MPLFHRARLALAGSSSSSGTQIDADPHDWDLPTSYSTSKSKGKQPVIPSPRIFSNATVPRCSDINDAESILQYPDPSHAAVHLALLECSRKLRLSASALEVDVDRPPEYNEKPISSTASGPIRLPESERWNLLIKLAITRFGVWWSKLHLVFTHASAYASHGRKKAEVQLNESYIPPLDVLLVWYAFMLHSDSYITACQNLEDEVPGVSNLCFPWMAIRAVIDMETMTFELPRSAQNLFSTLSGQSADILKYLEGPPAYSEEPSYPFPLDLFEEVKKHEPFIEDAHSLLWIRSPAISGSLERSAAEYVKHQLAGTGDAVPESNLPFGVRLFWRTHQLYPRLYSAFLDEAEVERGSDTGEAVGKDAKGQGEASRKPPCCCWTCERIRDDVPEFIRTRVLPSTSPSSSNTLATMKEQLSSLSSDELRQIQDDLGFYNAVEKARRRGKTLPTRPPTPAELEAEKTAKERQDRVGYLPGINEYVEVLPDGTRKIRRSKYANAWRGLSWAT
jgi:hypothetical protein